MAQNAQLTCCGGCNELEPGIHLMPPRSGAAGD